MRLPCFFSLVLVACGKAGAPNGASLSSTGAAFRALANGQHAEALKAFDVALDPASAGCRDVAVARCEALAHVRPDEALAALKRIQDVHPREYGIVVQALLEGGHFAQAVAVMDQGVKLFPGNAAMEKFQKKVTAEVMSASEASTMDLLDQIRGVLDGSDRTGDPLPAIAPKPATSPNPAKS